MSIIIPQPIAFMDENDRQVDFLDAPDLEALGMRLITKHSARFGYLNNATVRYLWKRDGGASGGKSTLGKCTKVSGIARHYAECDFVIWAAADHCAALHFTDQQLEALIFHELCHTGYEVTETGVRLVVAPHDLEVFPAEIQEYGLWTEDLKRLRQLPLFAESRLDEMESIRAGGLAAIDEVARARAAEADGAVKDGLARLADDLEAAGLDVRRNAPIPLGPSRGTHYRDPDPARPPMVCRDPGCKLDHYPVAGTAGAQVPA